MNSLCIDVYLKLMKFLEQQKLPGARELKRDTPDSEHTAPDNQTLFEAMLRGKPELKAQGLLKQFLVREFGENQVSKEFRGGNRRVDFLIRRGNEQVIIELKHYSAHQPDLSANCTGPFGTLLGPNRQGKESLHKDFEKWARVIPMIQVGLFTAVERWAPACYSSRVGSTTVAGIENKYTFLRSYVAHPARKQYYEVEARAALNASWVKREHVCPQPYRAVNMNDFHVGPLRIITSSGIKISGRVNYYVGVCDLNRMKPGK